MSENFEPSQNPMNMNEESARFLSNDTELSAEKMVPSKEANYSSEENNFDEVSGNSSLGNIVKNSSSSGRVSGSSNTYRRTIGGVASSISNKTNATKSGRVPRARRMSLSLVRVDAWS
ncbi:hypothetical protein CJI52_04230, partial [Bifidobacteriaceae bacterium WP022]